MYAGSDLRHTVAPRYLPVPDAPKVSSIAVRAMIAVIATMAVVAAFANVQRIRRHKIETVIVTPIATPSPSPTTE